MGKQTVLVIEDTDLNLKLIKTLLHLGHYNVLEAYDGESGIRMARTHRPDLILMDIQLRGMDGLEATRLIRSDDTIGAVPIVAVTAHAMGGDREKAMEAGFTGYITKPIDTRSFLDRLAEYVKPNGKQAHVKIGRADLIVDMKAGKGTVIPPEPVLDAKEAALNHAICDEQTGLYNYGYFNHFLNHEFKRAQRENLTFSLIVIDTAELVSKKRPHPADSGSQVIRRFARVVQDNIREIDLPARFSDHKISVLLPLADRNGAVAVAGRIRKATGSVSAGHQVEPEMRLSICSFPSEASTVEDLIRIADTGCRVHETARADHGYMNDAQNY